MPFIRKVHVLFKTPLIFSRINGPIETRERERESLCLLDIGVRAGGAAAPPHFGQLRFFGQQEKIWAKPFFKDVSVFFLLV